MDFDVSTPSVTEALGDLQLKIQSAQEDKELYASLEAKACASFERHRAELTLLLQKERAIQAAVEDRLRVDLQRLLAENEAMQSQVAQLRQQREQRCREEVRARQQQREVREDALRRELAELRDQWNTTCADVSAAQQEKLWHELQLREALERQQALNAELQQRRSELEERLAAEAQRQQQQHGSRHHSWGLEKVFLPAGMPDPCHTKSPSSHHIAAIVSTVERQNCYKPRTYYRRRGIVSPIERRLQTPPRCCNSRSNDIDNNSANGSAAGDGRPPPPLLAPKAKNIAVRGTTSTTMTVPSLRPPLDTSTGGMNRGVTKSGRHLAAVCRSLLREILQMRKEYQQCTAVLDDPTTDSVEVSRRMRSIMGDLDRKVHQLRSLRQQQMKVEDKLKLHDMMMEIAAENNYCESMYSDLIDLIRS